MKEFTSFAGFAEHILFLAATEKIREDEALEEACVLIETRAKEKFGEYQPAAGPFAAWSPLAPATVDDRIAKGYTPDDPLLRDGTARDSIEHKITGHEGHVGSDLDIMVWLELGTSKMPPRSTLGSSAFECEPQIVRDVGIEFSSWLAGSSRKVAIR